MSAAQSTAVRLPRSAAARATSPAVGRPDVGRPAPAARPRLQVVRAPAHARTRVPFVLLCMSVLAASLLGALLLNTSMAQGEYERFALQTRLAQSAQSQQRISAQLDLAGSPAQLAAAARALGMEPSAGAGYLRLSDGAVLGNPVPAGAAG
ncbi:hypothetical protein [Cellulomonas sp. KRMCY2]|uniref:hypothetical protein n=1 Tax=Cellulomonas sp. KRMCY2 TaxID=1304865 RepID=UPI00045EA2A0|nr:hypothetical protein [Cellulomonas sp. KRMCY2]